MNHQRPRYVAMNGPIFVIGEHTRGTAHSRGVLGEDGRGGGRETRGHAKSDGSPGDRLHLAE